MIPGYFLKLLEIDLSRLETKMIDIDEKDAKAFIGGSGLGAKLLFHYTSPETDPLGPENALIFMTGPYTGTKVFSSDRYQVITKSPLTGIYAESDSGGHWGESLKRCGVEGLVIIGKSENPVHIIISDDKVEVKDAGHLWSKDTWEVDELMKSEVGRKSCTVSIGIAGENLVKFSSIMNDGKHGRAAGRAGCGCVMGSKRLKAITVLGTKKVEIHDEDALTGYIKKMAPVMRDSTEVMRKYGTSCGIEYMEGVGDFPVKNWLLGNFAPAKKMTGQYMAKTILVDNYRCGRCIIGCGRTVEVKMGTYKMEASAGPEYETIAMLGSNCMVGDLEAISKGNELCNRYGLDTISTGSAIAFCMEAFEKNLITTNDTGGLKMDFGSPAAVLGMITKIAKREDIGRDLGEGLVHASKKIGYNSSEFAMQVKGLDFPAHDPRAKTGLGVSYATSNRGACHLQSFTADWEDNMAMPDLGYPDTMDRFKTEGKGKFVTDFQNLMSLIDSLRCCKFVLFGGITVEPLLKMLNIITGWKMTKEEFLKTGERIYNLKRLYNVREGITRKDDTLPPRILNNPRGGGSGDNIPVLNIMLRDYYRERGWDEFGIPTQETVERLGIVDFYQSAVEENIISRRPT
ncbi:MAG: aldehyde ferredoxin oxidoreductase family protein [Spirochaetes bacterium]|nr:aldehyde ferredoxin oxidoreductase family protein [Spirochaetota bacterium]